MLSGQNILTYEEDLQRREETEAMQKADPLKAQLYKDRHSLRMVVNNNYTHYPLCTNNEEFGKYSIGVQMYFNFLKSSTLVFALMALISILPLVSNIYGDGLSPTQINMAFDVCTLGNQPVFTQQKPANFSQLSAEQQKIIQDEFLQTAEAYQSKMELRLFSVSLPDLLYSLVFMVYIFYLRISNDRQIKEDKLHHRSITDFAIEVKGFPETVVNENDIFIFFSQFGEVIEAKLARNYFGTLLDYTNQAELEVKYNIEKGKNLLNGGKSSKKLKRIEKRIQKLKHSSARKLEKQYKDVPKVFIY